MKEKSLAILICIIIALSILGFTYAQWNDTITITSTMQFGTWTQTIRFVDPKECSDNEAAPIDVGRFNCYYTEPDPAEGYKKLVIEISNAYPSYAVDCSFTLKNIGAATSKIVAVTISDHSGELKWMWTTEHIEGFLWKDFDGDGEYDLSEEIIYIIITELVGVELNPSATMAAQIDVHVADNAEECNTYCLEVEIAYD